MQDELILLLIVFPYLLRITLFEIGFFIEKRKSTKNLGASFQPTVSVVVPAKNEEKYIYNCIQSIAQSNYPAHLFEIIAVNDRSTDKTGAILDTLANKIHNLKVINIRNESQHFEIRGKQAALQTGIENANCEIILMTDADCTVSPNWIKGMVIPYQNPRVEFVASYTHVVGDRIFDKLQAIEWMYLNTMAMGAVGLSQAMGCFGNNISVRRSGFYSIGGYKNITFSVTEDLALQRAIFESGYKIHYLISTDTLVNTKPCDSFKEYIRQHHRWAQGGLKLGWRSVFFILSSFSIWVGLLFFLINFNLPMVLAILFFRFIGDLLLLLPPSFILRKLGYLKYLPLAEGLFLFMELLVPLIVFYPVVKWKGQTFRL
ncbi:MAG: glycosyltransferase [Candidatus Kapaibacteriales bacterium]